MKSVVLCQTTVRELPCYIITSKHALFHLVSASGAALAINRGPEKEMESHNCPLFRPNKVPLEKFGFLNILSHSNVPLLPFCSRWDQRPQTTQLCTMRNKLITKRIYSWRLDSRNLLDLNLPRIEYVESDSFEFCGDRKDPGNDTERDKETGSTKRGKSWSRLRGWICNVLCWPKNRGQRLRESQF